MSRYGKELPAETEIFAGIDLHERTWTVTARTKDVELFTKGISGKWLLLRGLLERYKGCKIRAVYEAVCFGYWLYDELRVYGVECIVTPPSSNNTRASTDSTSNYIRASSIWDKASGSSEQVEHSIGQ